MNPTEVASFIYRHQAEMALALLEDEGITGVVVADDVGGMYPAVFGRARVLVNDDDADRARAVLADLQAEDDPA